MVSQCQIFKAKHEKHALRVLRGEDIGGLVGIKARFVGCVRTYRVKAGNKIKTPSVVMLRTAWASATLLRHVLFSTFSGLQGPERMIVKATVYAVTVQATMYSAIRKPILTSIRWYRATRESLASVVGQKYVMPRKRSDCIPRSASEFSERGDYDL